MQVHADRDLSPQEQSALDRLTAQGQIRVQLHQDGVFRVEDFILYGVLERLVIRKRIVYLGREGDQLNGAYSYALSANVEPSPAFAAPAALERNAARCGWRFASAKGNLPAYRPSTKGTNLA